MARPAPFFLAADAPSAKNKADERPTALMINLKPLLFVCAAFAAAARADEGMWLYNQPPRQILHDLYGFDPDEAWLEHLQKASVHVGSGGSGSFISADGLLISNHHVGAGSLAKLSTSRKNYLHDGFYARTQTEELKCMDLEINVLQSIQDVTARVNAAIPKDAGPEAAFAARRAIIAQIEKESQDNTGLRSDVVTLWQGGAYQLYCYKRYTDVRFVFAPEEQAGFFGGDTDNFEFPRYDLDICLFRAYENGRPARIKDYLRFSPSGPKEGDLVFVSGHPGRTSRLLTVDALKNLRDHVLPFQLAAAKREEVLLSSWSERNPENARRADRALLGVQNGRKANDGRLAGLLDPELMGAREIAETQFKAQLRDQTAEDKKALCQAALAAYDQIATATRIESESFVPHTLLEGGRAFNCESFRIARTLLRAGDERPKPNGQRLREFSDSGKTSLELALLSKRPIYTDLETLTLADSLTFFATELGGDNELVQKALAGKSPRERAAELIAGTRVRDAAFRKELYEGGAPAVAAARDPMIELARSVDGESRALRKIFDTQSEARQEAYAAIARARNLLPGTAGYPDATSTLRLAFGTVKGYEEDNKPVAPFTDFAGLFARAAAMNNRPPFNLAPSWAARQARLRPATPLDFVSTADIIGGNSGSPVVNRAGEFVGIIFDGNLESLPWDYAYGDKQGRAISVDSAAILEALDKIYGAKALTRELFSGHL